MTLRRFPGRPKWYVDVRGPSGKRHRIAAFTSKAASKRFDAKITELAETVAVSAPVPPDLQRWFDELPPARRASLARIGFMPGGNDPRNLAPLIEQWITSQIARGTTPAQQKRNRGILEQAMRDRGWTAPADITAASVEAHVVALKQPYAKKEGGKTYVRSHRTINAHLGAIRHFVRFLVDRGQLPASPLESLSPLPASLDRRHDRIHFRPKQLAALLAAAEESERTIHGLTGLQRHWLYRLAAMTGARLSELRSLTRSDVVMGKHPHLRISAAYSRKAKRTVDIPLRREDAKDLRKFLRGAAAAARLFPCAATGTAAMLREDLKAAKVPYRDRHGRYRDFHALRHTFAVMLATAGVHPSRAQGLLRHSTIALTMNVYTHVEGGELREALEQIPALPDPEAQS